MLLILILWKLYGVCVCVCLMWRVFMCWMGWPGSVVLCCVLFWRVSESVELCVVVGLCCCVVLCGVVFQIRSEWFQNPLTTITIFSEFKCIILLIEYQWIHHSSDSDAGIKSTQLWDRIIGVKSIEWKQEKMRNKKNINFDVIFILWRFPMKCLWKEWNQREWEMYWYIENRRWKKSQEWRRKGREERE